MKKTFIVIGAGMIGISIAARLAQIGVEVTLIDRTRLTPQYGTSATWVVWDPTLAPTQGVAGLIAASRAGLAQTSAYLPTPVLKPAGVVRIVSTDHVKRLGALGHWAHELALEYDILGQDELLPDYPELFGDAAFGALTLAPDVAAEVEVNVLYDRLMKLFNHLGGRVVRDAEVLSARHTGGAWWVETTAGRLKADTLVNAAGADAETVGARCGARPMGLRTHKRTMVVGRIDRRAGAPPPATRSPFMTFLGEDCDLTFRTAPHGEVWALRDERSPADGAVTLEPEDIARAIDSLEARTHYRLEPHIRAAWSISAVTSASPRLGRGPQTVPSGDPIIGWDERLREFFWAAGFGDYTVLCAPAVGELAGDLLMRRRLVRRLYEDYAINPAAFEPASV